MIEDDELSEPGEFAEITTAADCTSGLVRAPLSLALLQLSLISASSWLESNKKPGLLPILAGSSVHVNSCQPIARQDGLRPFLAGVVTSEIDWLEEAGCSGSREAGSGLRGIAEFGGAAA